MATYYLDFALGSDAADGSSWANAWKTLTSGATAARIAAGDVIKIAKSPDPYSIGSAVWKAGPNRATSYLSITGSTNATPIVVTVSAHGLVTGDYVLIHDHSTNTNANGVWKVTYVDANKVSLDGSVGNGTGGYSGYLRNITGKVVELSSAVTKTITNCDKVWTAANSASVVLNGYSVAKQGIGSMKCTLPGSPATNTKYAYYALPATLDLSAYQNVTFWIYNNTAFIADRWKICLCSDAAGATIVDTIAIPAIPCTGRWIPITVVTGGNLGASIASIALYSAGTAPTGSSYIYLDNIVACTTSGLNLQSLISRGSAAQGGDDGWFPIQSIDETVLMLDNDSQNVVYAGRGSDLYTAATVTTYARETTKAAFETSSSGTTTGTVNDSGSAGSLIQFQGGYNRDSGNQDGETFLDWLNGYGYGFNLSSKNYIQFNYLNAVRSNYGFNVSSCNTLTIGRIGAIGTSSTGINIYGVTSATLTITDILAISCNGTGIYISSSNFVTITNVVKASCNLGSGLHFYISLDATVTTVKAADNNSSTGVNIGGYSPNFSDRCTITTITSACLNSSYGLLLDGVKNVSVGTVTKLSKNTTGLCFFSTPMDCVVKLISEVNYNTSYAILLGGHNTHVCEVTDCSNNAYAAQISGNAPNNRIDKISGSGNAKVGYSYSIFPLIINNGSFTESEANLVLIGTTLNYQEVRYTNFGGSASDHRIYTDGGNIKTDATTRHTASGTSWKFTFANSSRTSNYPLRVCIAYVAFDADSLVTIKAFVRRSASTVGVRLRIYGGAIPGVGNDDLLATGGAGSVGDWEELTLTFTPTIAGVVQVYCEAYYISSYSETCWVDDMTISQA